jgi:hypothetical protein
MQPRRRSADKHAQPARAGNDGKGARRSTQLTRRGIWAGIPQTTERDTSVQQVEVAVIGTGWCGGIRAETLSRSSIVDKLHICEIKPERLAEVKKLTNAASATS